MQLPTKGIFNHNLLDEAACRKAVLSWFYPEGPRCPTCFGTKVDAEAFWEGKPQECPRCGGRFTARTKTPLYKTHLTYAQIVALGIMGEMDLQIKDAAKRLGLALRTAYAYREKFFNKDGEI